jgi:hypothetical protein
MIVVGSSHRSWLVPIPAFIRRLSDGSTSIGGVMPRRSSSRDRNDLPSVM